MVSIHDVSEYDFVSKYLPPGPGEKLWLGVSWTWSDGSALSSWYPGNTDCQGVRYLSRGKDPECSLQLPFVCKKTQPTSTTTSASSVSDQYFAGTFWAIVGSLIFAVLILGLGIFILLQIYGYKGWNKHSVKGKYSR